MRMLAPLMILALSAACDESEPKGAKSLGGAAGALPSKVQGGDAKRKKAATDVGAPGVLKKIGGGDMKAEIASPDADAESGVKAPAAAANAAAPRDAATGLPTGKRRHTPPAVVAPRDAASGLPTGKRKHDPPTVVAPQ